MKRTISIISILSIIAIVVCSFCLCLAGCESTKQMNASVVAGDMLSIKQVTALEAITLEVSAPLYLAGGDSGSAYTSQTVTAVITPDSVQDKYVTWSVAWAEGASLASKSVTDYIVLEQDGTTTCRLKCYKSFRGSNIILTCRTRQDNKTCTATITFNGIPSSMSLGNSQGQGSYNLGSMTVPLLKTNSSYTVPISLDNIFHDVGTNYNNYTVTVSGVGTVTLGDYVITQRGQGWNSHDSTVELSSIANQLVTCSIVDGNKLKIVVNKSIYGYYERVTEGTSEGNGNTTHYYNKVYEVHTDSDGNEPYVVITVRHNTYGFTATYKCFIQETVESVSISGSTTITF